MTVETIEYRNRDKTGWGRGPWQDEPDKMQFQDEATGLPCLIVRNNSGALCGYVGVTEGHPLFGRDYDEARSADGEWIDVHGGLTFSDTCCPSPEGEGRGICHVPGDGEPDHVWWFGFDCAHSGDFMPSYNARSESCFRQGPLPEYRTVAYVKGEIRSLAQQLARIPSGAYEVAP